MDSAPPAPPVVRRERFLEKLIAHATPATEHDATFGLVVVKLAHLREINHAFGFAAGDACLEAIGGRLKRIARPQDVVGHLGGGLFGLLIAEPCDEALLELAINRLLDELEPNVRIGERTVAIACRAAGGLYRDHGPTPDALLAAVEDGLHQAFRDAQRYRLIRPRPYGRVTDDFTLLRAIENAIDNSEFVLNYQPQLRLADHAVTGFEALLRWDHPRYAGISPERMIPVAERNDVIVPLTRWTFNAALRQFSELQALPDRTKVSINLSAQLLTHRGILDIIADALAIWDVAPQRLMVEITETSMMLNPEAGIAAVHDLRDLGVRVSIDDFGTGYSSLAYLERLPLDELKIDKSFVGKVTSNDHDKKIVRAILDLAHTFGMQVVAEGVEDQATEDLLLAFGCDVGQGYLYSRPVAAEMLDYWLLALPAATPS
ncbi:MAG: GGDEF domain-containing phosphodiesterase [Gammaproteobacteria bacterium]|nr:GGDEF domain-containing phosphodiesterase [Gammaproteobacteria bacterium]